MLRQAVQGARWYQHVARKSPSIASLCPRSFSTVTPRYLNFGGPDDKVRFYEKATAGSKKLRQIDPEAEDRSEQAEVEDELAQLKRDLEVLEAGPYAPNSPFMRSLPEKERALALEALEKHKAEQGNQDGDIGLENVFDAELDEMLQKEFEGLAMEQENWNSAGEVEDSHVPVVKKPYEVVLEDTESHAYVDKFNECLRKFARDSSKHPLKQDLWKWYRRCKQVVPGFLESMPEEAFALVWDSQATEAAGTSQTSHLQVIAEDALSNGRSLSTPHILGYIRSLQNSGKTDQALDQWEARQTELSQRKEDLEAYWKLGVRLFSAAEDPQRAQDIALAFLATDKSRQPRILIPVITAWGRQPGKEAEVKAWSLYLQLKTFLGSTMTMVDYDHISIGFLKANRLSLAIAVFKDMMVTGQDPANDSTALYKAALGVAGNLHASSISEKDVNKISLSALTVLPRKFQNRFFYASWMKKLIGMGEVDSAALVIELMYERGVKPDPKHLNGLIAAWLREGNTASRAKAEQLGWGMVQQRIDTVWARTGSSGSAPQLSVNHKSDNVRVPKFMQRQVPAANIETFSILLLHYTRRSDDDMVKYLIKCLGDGRIQPNSYFMNHLLYAELRKQDLRSLWNKFKTMSTTIKPDLETYACLWDCGKLQYDRGRTSFDAGFPSARSLYQEMAQWFSQLTPHGKTIAQEEFSKELYDQIIRCFCLSKDLHGTIVALHAMATTFSFYPDEATARLIILQVARLAGVPTDTPKRRLRRLSSTPKSKENIANVNRLVEILSERKAATLEAHGLKPENLEPREKQQYQLEILVDLLRAVMGRAATDPTRIEDKIVAAAKEMGITGIDLGLPLGKNDSLLL